MQSSIMHTSSLAGHALAPQVVQSRARVNRMISAAATSSRPVWFPGNKRPEHLEGDAADLAGNFGFDPLGLGTDPATLKWFVQAELVHCRWAMTAVVGILLPELATLAGALNVPNWYEAGKVFANEHPEIPQPSLLFTELLLMGWVETKRWLDFRSPGSQAGTMGPGDGLKGFENGYPGGWFDPLGLGRTENADLRRKYKENEVKNGRLAMVALVGFVFQHIAYPGTGPVDNLIAHVKDPYHVTFATNGVSLPFLQPEWRRGF